MIPIIAINIIKHPMRVNELCKPNNVVHIPNHKTPITSHIFPTNSPTPVIVPISSILAQSEILLHPSDQRMCPSVFYIFRA